MCSSDLRNIERLTKLAQEGERIYASANEADLKKAVRLFKERQLANDYDASPYSFYRKLDNRWFSCVGKSPQKEGKVWMLDVDDHEEEAEVKAWCKRNIHEYSYGTKNGMHVFIKPTNKEKLSELLLKCLNENPLMLVAY